MDLKIETFYCLKLSVDPPNNSFLSFSWQVSQSAPTLFLNYTEMVLVSFLIQMLFLQNKCFVRFYLSTTDLSYSFIITNRHVKLTIFKFLTEQISVKGDKSLVWCELVGHGEEREEDDYRVFFWKHKEKIYNKRRKMR